MKKKENNQTLFKEATSRTKKNFSRKFSLLSIVFLLLTLSLMLGFVFPISLYLSVPFVVLPTLFSYQAMNTVIDNDKLPDTPGFFILYRTFFSQGFIGGYRAIIGYLKSILVFVIVSFLTSTVLISFFLIKDPEFAAIYNSLSTLTDIEAIEKEFTNFLLNNETYIRIVEIASISGMCGGLVMFLHHLNINSIKFYMSLLGTGMFPYRDLNVIHKKVFIKIKKPFRKDYYKALWFMPIVLILGFALGTLVGTLFNVSVEQIIVIGFFGALLLSFMFLPLVEDINMLLYEKYSEEYVSTFVTMSIDTINAYKKEHDLPKEKEEEIMKFLNEKKSHLKESKEEEETTNDNNEEDHD